jgi:hypothetical protein
LAKIEGLRPVTPAETVSIVVSFPLNDNSRHCMDLGDENVSQSAESREWFKICPLERADLEVYPKG